MEKKNLTLLSYMVSIFSHFKIRSFRNKNHDNMESSNINALKPATFTLLDNAAQAFHLSLTYLADSISQSGRPLLYCFVKSVLKR